MDQFSHFFKKSETTIAKQFSKIKILVFYSQFNII